MAAMHAVLFLAPVAVILLLVLWVNEAAGADTRSDGDKRRDDGGMPIFIGDGSDASGDSGAGGDGGGGGGD